MKQANGRKRAPQRQGTCPYPQQQQDEYYCPQRGCGMRWEVQEDKPPCPKGH